LDFKILYCDFFGLATFVLMGFVVVKTYKAPSTKKPKKPSQSTATGEAHNEWLDNPTMNEWNKQKVNKNKQKKTK